MGLKPEGKLFGLSNHFQLGGKENDRNFLGDRKCRGKPLVLAEEE